MYVRVCVCVRVCACVRACVCEVFVCMYGHVANRVTIVGIFVSVVAANNPKHSFTSIRVYKL